jgi:nucleobase:cation symporter-1, NCS1 family
LNLIGQTGEGHAASDAAVIPHAAFLVGSDEMADAAQQARETAEHEIMPVPHDRRTLGALDIGVLWGDLGVGLLVLVAGALLVPGLGLRDALIAIVIGSVIGSALLAIVGRIGTDTGVPTMVALRAPLGIRGSFIASGLNVAQLIGWAGLEFIIMAEAAKAISNEFFGFEGYYWWLAGVATLATVFAITGPTLVVRQFLQRFGMWVVIAATAWLTYRLFATYDVHTLLDDDGAGGWPNFWQGVDIAVALPVSWLPLVADYTRYARKSNPAAWATFISYTIANIWFFALGAGYVLVLNSSPAGNQLVFDLVDSLLPLALGWVFLFVILVDETDNAFANVYSTAVSLQNVVRVPRAILAVAVGATAFAFAVAFDLAGYETFLLLIGGVFVSLFGVLVADYYVTSRQRYALDELYVSEGRYWYVAGFSPAGLLAWAAGFAVYAVCGQPLWLVERAEWIADVPSWMTEVGGTIPSFAVSFALYVGLRWVLGREAPGVVRDEREALA